MKEKVLLLAAQPYDMDGNKGVSIHYINNSIENTARMKGVKPLKSSSPFEILPFLPDKLPAYVDVEFIIKNVGGKAQVMISNIIGQPKQINLFT